MRAVERIDVVQSFAEEDGRGDDEHGNVDQAGDRHRDQHVDPRVAVEGPSLVVVLRDDPVLRQRGVQVDHMRHHRRADDADGEQHGLVALEVGNDRMLRHGSERRMRQPQLAEVADADHGDERRDHGFERAEAEALQSEDQERDHARQHRGREKRDPKQQLQAERGTEELREVGRHRNQLSLHPERNRRTTREPLAADLRQVAPRRDAELRGEGLDQHRHQVRGDDHPDEREAELRAARDVRREVARVDVGDAGDEGGAEERPDRPLVAAQRALARAGRTIERLYAGAHHSRGEV